MKYLPILACCILLGCEISLGAPDATAIANFDGETAQEVTYEGSVQWVDDDGKFAFATTQGEAFPVVTGMYRQPVNVGQIVIVQGWQEPDKSRRILARRITTPDGRQVFP